MITVTYASALVGGGILTKAADAGAGLVGKVEAASFPRPHGSGGSQFTDLDYLKNHRITTASFEKLPEPLIFSDLGISSQPYVIT